MMHFKALLLLAFFMAGSVNTHAQQKPKPKAPEMQIREYWFVLLKSGPNRFQDSATAAQIQAGHMANMMRLYKDGKLKVAGPFGEDGDWQGIFIFDGERREVEALLQTDPAIKAGRLLYEIHSWWTSPIGSFKPGKPAATH